jgi:hypothetical protein
MRWKSLQAYLPDAKRGLQEELEINIVQNGENTAFASFFRFFFSPLLDVGRRRSLAVL